jgi:hypothetical protein
MVSLGGGGAIVLAFSNFLGKIWADRLMAKERSEHEKELAELRAKLEKANDECLSKLRMDLEIYRDTYLKQHNDKLGTYGFVSGVIVDFLADLDMMRLGQKPDGNPLDRFNRGRLKAHCFLGMLAPQKVLDAYDSLVDYIFTILEPPGTPMTQEKWKEVRRLGYILINAIREDIGIDKSNVEYRGKR